MSGVSISFVIDMLGDQVVFGEGENAGALYRKDLAPGSAQWCVAYSEPDKIVDLMFVCPCGCGSIGHCAVEKHGNHPMWTWDGNKEKPTLSPSIQRTHGCKWHGFLRAGIFESC